MTTTTTPTTTSSHRSIAAALLARRGTVYLPTHAGQPTVDTLAGVALLDADLLDRGYLMSAELRQAMAALDVTTLTAQGRALLADIDHALGADRPHVPLFRNFPQSTPCDTLAFYTDRVLAVLLQAPEQPCVLCGSDSTVHAISPCAHLICHACFDGSDISACPICHRSIDANDPFLRPQRPRRASGTDRGLPHRLRVLSHGGDHTARTADAGHELTTLLSRPTALSPQDTDHLSLLLEARNRRDLSWLPETIPGRETKARTLSWLLADPTAYDVTLPAAAARINTATDVLRLLAVRSGGDAGLIAIPFTAVPRPLRRALLSILDNLDTSLVAEDMRRHSKPWKQAAERLHPFEHTNRFPKAALAFAALRGFRLTGDTLSTRLSNTASGIPAATAAGSKVLITSWAAEVEGALTRSDILRALTLLAQRPGELLRRLDHLLRTADDADMVFSALVQAAPRVAPAVLLSALGEIRSRTRKGTERVFFPKGGNAKAHIVADQRAPLTANVVERAEAILTGEILNRAGKLEHVELAVVDAALDGVIAPFAERTASRALVTLPRGSELPVPAGRTIRLFLHWMESDTSGRTDLDLSTALYNANWQHVGTCDYTNLRFARAAAVHSGDLTSAPAPQGASEFVDLDLEQLAAAGVRYLVASVYSFNNVAFDDLGEAFAGLMLRDEPGTTGEVFDARQVEQRFDLTGQARASVPMVIDVAARTMRWLDVAQGVTGTHHAVHRYADDLATLGQGLTNLFTSGARVGLGELATWQAAARADAVIVRHTDGSHSTYRRRTGETTTAFASRLGTPATDDAPDLDITQATLTFLLRGDITLPGNSEVFALHPAGLDTAHVRLMTASDIATSLG
ncbi:MXAN_6230/SCO0854 family RING domain-containing protein [Streptomyces yaizuensis]|uniref:TerD family protein n=1 Tax=Streptomyces yaizuensis TaxID=2989713 RepID=A0ABQ5P628_9ACTN|nr:MXAN_6230/SCO0854 family RING domain-containing protein [Streptomyces sp. YSPA8]GLF98044.1 TerD family protein [Streptomyces sp. YSPA8]